MARAAPLRVAAKRRPDAACLTANTPGPRRSQPLSPRVRRRIRPWRGCRGLGWRRRNRLWRIRGRWRYGRLTGRRRLRHRLRLQGWLRLGRSVWLRHRLRRRRRRRVGLTRCGRIRAPLGRARLWGVSRRRRLRVGRLRISLCRHRIDRHRLHIDRSRNYVRPVRIPVVIWIAIRIRVGVGVWVNVVIWVGVIKRNADSDADPDARLGRSACDAHHQDRNDEECQFLSAHHKTSIFHKVCGEFRDSWAFLPVTLKGTVPFRLVRKSGQPPAADSIIAARPANPNFRPNDLSCISYRPATEAEIKEEGGMAGRSIEGANVSPPCRSALRTPQAARNCKHVAQCAIVEPLRRRDAE